MKNLIIAGALLAATTAHAKSYDCKGVYENKGTSVELTIGRDGSYSLRGTSVEGEGFAKTVACSGDYSGKDAGAYGLYRTDDDAEACPVDTVKIMKSIKSEGSGMLVLVRTSGGDTHDFSGYAYRYYRCE